MADRPSSPSAEVATEDRRNVVHWDMGLHRGLTRLDINTPPRDSAGAWASETNQAVQAQAERAAPTVRFDTEPRGVAQAQAPPAIPARILRLASVLATSTLCLLRL